MIIPKELMTPDANDKKNYDLFEDLMKQILEKDNTNNIDNKIKKRLNS